MNPRINKLMDDARSGVMSGNPAAALAGVERLADHLARRGLPVDERAAVQDGLNRLLRLAEASARGAEQAISQVRDILRTARSLQTYDREGRRQSAPTAAPAPHRF